MTTPIPHFIDGRRMIPHVTIADVERIEQNYGNTGNPAYKKSPHEMHQKTAMKKLLKPAAREAEGLSMMLTLDNYEYTPPLEPLEPDMRDVTERMGDKLDSATEGLEPGEMQGCNHDLPPGITTGAGPEPPKGGYPTTSGEPRQGKKTGKAESGVEKGDLF